MVRLVATEDVIAGPLACTDPKHRSGTALDANGLP
jgi:hypothetical protein